MTDFNALVLAEMRKLQASRVPSQVRAGASSPSPTEVSGWRIQAFDVTTGMNASLLSTLFSSPGYGFAILKGASDPIPLAIDVAECGKYGPVYPGVGYMTGGKFSRLSFKPWTSLSLPPAGAFTTQGLVAPTGRVTIAIAQRPDAKIIDTATDLPGFVWGRATSQLYGSAAGQIPTSAFDGINIRGASAARCWVQSGNGNVTGGAVQWYWFDPSSAIWHLTDLVQPLPTGSLNVSPGEVQVAHKYGRYFPSLVNYTNPGGAVVPGCQVWAFGEGGDLGSQDVIP